MQRVLWLTAAAFVLVWAGALLDFGDAHDQPRRARSSTEDSVAAAPGRERVVAPGQASPAPGKQPPEPAQKATGTAPGGQARAARGSLPAPRPGQGEVHVIGSQPAVAAPGVVTRPERAAPSQQAEDPLRGELGEGVISPEYAEIEQSYVNEPRDGVWAMAEEQRIRGVLQGSAVGPQVALVHCQESVCRIVLETDSPDSFRQLVDVPGFTAATGIGPNSPYSLRGGQLSVYFHGRREDSAAASK